MGNTNKKIQLNIVDIQLFKQVLATISKISPAAKLLFNNIGITVYAKNTFCRGEFFSSAVSSPVDVEVCINDLKTFTALLDSAIDLNADNLGQIKIEVAIPFIYITSTKFKTKYITCKEETITPFISPKKVTAEYKLLLTFVTNNALIKKINRHSFILDDISTVRLYLTTEQDMENNKLYCTVGNMANELNRSVTLEIGDITDIDESFTNKPIILDLDRLMIFDIINSDKISISLSDKSFLVYENMVQGKNNSYMAIKIFSTILVK